MTELLHLRRLRVRYRVGGDDPALRRRLDAVLERVLDEQLEAALARSGVPRDEEVCVRSLHVPIRLRLDGGEAGAAAAWSSALADAIASALAGGPGPDVVSYRSRRAALVDLVVGVSAGRHERAWAWRRLGLWQGGDAPGDRGAAVELLRALTAEPEAVVPALAAAATAGTLPSLVARVAPAGLLALARAALTAAGGSPAVLDAPARERPSPRVRAAGTVSADPAAGDLRAQVESVWRASSIVRAAAHTLPPASQSGELAVALAVLGLLEAVPDIAPTLTATPVDALAAEIASRALPTPPQPHTRADELEPDDPDGSGGRQPAEPAEAGADHPRWETSYGGLLFLLGVLDDLGVPQEVTHAAPLARRPLRWTLHRLALTLVPADARDPAALAFAGLPPDAEPPADDAEPWGDAELDALAELREQIGAHLRERLVRPDAPTGELVDLVCRRRGEIVFDPGWIEIRLPLDEVSHGHSPCRPRSGPGPAVVARGRREVRLWLASLSPPRRPARTGDSPPRPRGSRSGWPSSSARCSAPATTARPTSSGSSGRRPRARKPPARESRVRSIDSPRRCGSRRSRSTCCCSPGSQRSTRGTRRPSGGSTRRGRPYPTAGLAGRLFCVHAGERAELRALLERGAAAALRGDPPR